MVGLHPLVGIPLIPARHQTVHTAVPKRPERILTANVIPPILRDVVLMLQLQASWSLS